jgi:hypothetical protein
MHLPHNPDRAIYSLLPETSEMAVVMFDIHLSPPLSISLLFLSFSPYCSWNTLVIKHTNFYTFSAPLPHIPVLCETIWKLSDLNNQEASCEL